MKIRDVCSIGVIAGLTVTFCFLVFGGQQNDPIRYENFEKIEIGMSRDEVKKVLGCGPCRYENGVTYTSMCAGKPSAEGPSRADPFGIWEGESAKINITFRNDRVEQKSIENKVIQPAYWIGRLKRSLGFGEWTESTFTTVGE